MRSTRWATSCSSSCRRSAAPSRWGRPELINSDPYGSGWILRLKPSGGADGLLDAAGYSATLSEG